MRKGRASWRAIAIAAVCGLLSPRPGVPFDCNQNLVEDFEEIQAGAVPDCDGNGIPDACDIAPVNHGLAVLLLEFLFRSGRSPAAPGPPPGPCGLDTDLPGSAADLGCTAYEGC